MAPASFVIADVFTDKKFGGNQLAVFTDGREIDSVAMQNIAREMNYSETTFLLPAESGGDFKVRIFTPRNELPFAGHPLVGSAYVIAAEGLKQVRGPSARLTLETGAGLINVDLAVENGRPGRTTMTQPLPRVTAVAPDQAVKPLADALGLEAADILGTELPVEALSNGLTVLIVPTRSLKAIQSMQPDYDRLGQLSTQFGAETVLVFTTETVSPNSTAHCRVFAPAAGVFEDAATGSANGPLGYYMVSHKLVEAEPVTRIISEQGYEMNRPSTLFIEIDAVGGSGSVTAVRVGGDVVITGRGQILL
ncbi:MAG TPA: PhzF family phenazine biosynthesis protein [Blastocatellia bacterium]|nr:PhzF family phenazine biosynthesis protein [Blastocatellia bacterium]